MAQANRNRPKTTPILTHGGAPAVRTNAEQQLRRSVMSSLLWEDEFYEDGEAIAARIERLSQAVAPHRVAAMAIEARKTHHLRHVPLLLTSSIVQRASGTGLVSDTLSDVISRADELAEFLAIYWRNGKTPLAKQIKLGLGRAFGKFDEYQLAKYDRKGKSVRLADVLKLTRPKPKDQAQADLWKRLIEDRLATPDTWEVGLSTGGDKKETFTRLLTEGKLGYMALLRNLRNMLQSGVDRSLIREAIRARKGADNVLPFRFIAATRHAPELADVLNEALIASVKSMPEFSGTTAIVVDVSGSMDYPLSSKSDLTRMDAAAALAAIFPGDKDVYTFSYNIKKVASHAGLPGIEAIVKSQPHGGTDLGKAVTFINGKKYDRVVVITDEQTQTRVPSPVAKRAYMINVASNKNGVGYGKWSKWTHIDGFSENVIRWMREFEAM